MSCDCYTIGGPFIAEDPDCPEHGWEAQKERERNEIKLEGLNQRIRFLETERDALRADRRAFAVKVGHEITSWIDANDPMPDVERIVDAIAAKEPK